MLTIACLLLASLAAAPEGPRCAPPTQLAVWPTVAGSPGRPTAEPPVWALCFLRPADSSGPAGSGLEIRDAFYKGRRVLRRGGLPVVNVFYADGCGCSRGTMRAEAPFEVVGSSGPFTATAASPAEAMVPPRGVCEAGAERGVYRGVAQERLSDRLVLTSAIASGSDRFTVSWAFRLDGTIEPRVSFASLPSGCASDSHTHHAYWRFELDVGDDSAAPPAGRREEARQVGAGRKPPLGVRDVASGRGYVLVPGPESLDLPADAESVGDIWLLQAKDDELGDRGKGCGIDFGGLLNDEPVPEGHAVLWYRSGAYHSANDAGACDTVGPTLQPFGDWSRPRTSAPR